MYPFIRFRAIRYAGSKKVRLVHYHTAIFYALVVYKKACNTLEFKILRIPGLVSFLPYYFGTFAVNQYIGGAFQQLSIPVIRRELYQLSAGHIMS